MRVGVIEHCLNCGMEDISEYTFPHYGPICLSVLRSTGQLPNGILQQQRIQDETIDL
jgi:hypothetical protein